LSDGSIEITDNGGITYTFGLDTYRRNGSGGDFQEGQLNQASLVEFQSSAYVTNISDADGNSYDFTYSLSNNSDGINNRDVFVLERIKQGAATVAVFSYNNLNDDYGSTAAAIRNSPEIVLKRIKFLNRTIDYEYERIPLNTIVKPLQLTEVNTPANSGVDWKYEYYDYVGSALSANTANLKSVKNKYGGVTTYTYQKVLQVGAWIGIHTKKLSSYNGSSNEWRYEFDGDRTFSGKDTTTIYLPGSRVEQHIHCNARIRTTECENREGFLVERRIYAGSTGSAPIQTEYYDWRIDRRISLGILSIPDDQILAINTSHLRGYSD